MALAISVMTDAASAKKQKWGMKKLLLLIMVHVPVHVYLFDEVMFDMVSLVQSNFPLKDCLFHSNIHLLSLISWNNFIWIDS